MRSRHGLQTHVGACGSMLGCATRCDSWASMSGRAHLCGSPCMLGASPSRCGHERRQAENSLYVLLNPQWVFLASALPQGVTIQTLSLLLQDA